MIIKSTETITFTEEEENLFIDVCHLLDTISDESNNPDTRSKCVYVSSILSDLMDYLEIDHDY